MRRSGVRIPSAPPHRNPVPPAESPPQGRGSLLVIEVPFRMRTTQALFSAMAGVPGRSLQSPRGDAARGWSSAGSTKPTRTTAAARARRAAAPRARRGPLLGAGAFRERRQGGVHRRADLRWPQERPRARDQRRRRNPAGGWVALQHCAGAQLPAPPAVGRQWRRSPVERGRAGEIRVAAGGAGSHPDAAPHPRGRRTARTLPLGPPPA